MVGRRYLAVVALTAVTALLVAGCDGGEDGTTQSGGGDHVTVYSSLPLQAGTSRSQAAAIVAGIELALRERHGRAGDLRVEYRSLDDSTREEGGPAPGSEAANARNAVQDHTAVAYIGAMSFESTAISIPVLNEGGMVQVSPAATYDGLTKETPAAQRGEPEKYYPTQERTFARIVPIDSLQARVLAGTMRAAGCRDAYIVQEGATASSALGRALASDIGTRGMKLAGQAVVDTEDPDLDALAGQARDSGAGCAVYTGDASEATVQVYETIADALPGTRLFGADGVCRAGFVNPADGLPEVVGDRLTCTSVTRDIDTYPGGERIARRLPAGARDAHALYGYEAMRLVLDAIAKGGADRHKVRETLMATRDRRSPLGTYSFDENGDTTLAEYGVYRARGGRLRLQRVSRP